MNAPASLHRGSESHRSHPAIVATILSAMIVARLLVPSVSAADPLFAAPYLVAPSGASALADMNGDGRLDVISSRGVALGKGDGLFEPEIVQYGDDNVHSVAVGDMNADGLLDVVTPRLESFVMRGSTVAVALGTGAGTFRPEVEFLSSIGAHAVAIGDLDGDGMADVVSANQGDGTAPDGTVSVLLGNGDGTLRPRMDFATRGAPWSIAIADLDGDGRRDVVTGSSGPDGFSGGTVSVLLGAGDGTLGARSDIEAPHRPVAIAVGDLNADGALDLAIATEDDGGASILVLRGRGDGSFAARSEHETARGSSAVAIADVNHDGLPDLVTNRHLLLATGIGTFGPSVPYPGGRGLSVATGDLDGNGTIDIASGPYISLGNADGTFGSTPLTWDERPIAYVALGDLNGDRALDLVAPGFVLLNRGDGSVMSRVDYASGVTPYEAKLADLDRDGRLDLILVSGEAIGILLGLGDGRFGPETRIRAGWHPSVAIGDLDGDGTPDLVSADVLDLVVWPGNGDGTFGTAIRLRMAHYLTSVAIGDLDGDGRQDLVVATGETWGGVGTVKVLPGNGDGSFGEGRDHPVPFRVNSVTLADLDADRRLDLIVTNDNGVIGVMRGDGAGHLGAPVLHFAPGRQSPIAAIDDLNCDGKQDIAMAGQEGFSILIGNGDGTFEEAVSYGYGSPRSKSVAIGDLNGDGKPDLAGAGIVLWNVGPRTRVSAGLKLDPRTVHLGARRQWIGVTLEVPEPHAASEIEASSLRLNGVAAPVPGEAVVAGRRLTVKFAWEDVRGLLEPGDRVPVTITGLMANGTLAASGEIRVLDSRMEVVGVPEQAAGLAELALRPVTPVRGLAVVRLSLASAEPATLDVFDVHGRLVDRRAVTSEPGWQITRLQGLPSGHYFLRLTQGARSATSRVAIVR